MPNLNKIFLIGHTTRDMDLRFTPAGTAVGRFNLAVNSITGKNDDGTLKEDVLFIDVVMFSKFAETMKEYIKKGIPVFVSGRLSQRKWTDKNGNKRTTYEVIVKELQLLPKKNGNENIDENPF